LEGKLNTDGTSKVLNYNLGPVNPEDTQKLGSQSFQDEKTKADFTKNQAQAELINKVSGQDIFVQDRNGTWKVNYEKYRDWKR
jgi:hypothetical protein